MVKEELCENVAEVRTVGDRVMAVVLAFEDVLKLICEHVLQNGSLQEKQSLYDQLKNGRDAHCADSLIVFLVDISGCVCRHIDGIYG